MAASIADYAEVLAAGIEEALPGWVTRSVEQVMRAWTGEVPAEVAAAAERAAGQARREAGAAIRALLAADIDEQRTTPLALLRTAVRYPTEVLRDAGVPPVDRDPVQVRLLPDDIYDLSPASFADVDPALAEPGMVWGAAKALAHRRRHAP